MQSSSWYRCLVAVVLATSGLLPQGAAAGPLLTMDITDPTRSALAGDSLVFSGALTNRTGVALQSTDLFLSFVGYDPDVLLPDQVLGLLPFTLANLTFRSNVALFSVDVDAAARAGTYGFNVQLQDLAGNLSDITAVTLNVRSTGATVAEPSALALVLLAAFAAWGTQRRHRCAGGLNAERC